jgi:hypothetical protein
MKIELHKILVRDLFDGYIDSAEEGVKGYGGKLDIRPKYQREFVYKPEQRNAVINSILSDYPLNVMYWVKNSTLLEVLDGQQRILSICEYIKGNFSIEYRAFANLPDDEQEKILNYELMVYFCEGTDSEKLAWFKIVNIAGETLTDQELRNAVYAGSWLSEAKRYFSKTGCVAYQVGNKYLKGIAIRQEYLEKAIEWISDNDINNYMSAHQHDPNAVALWTYFQTVITWAAAIFPKYRNEMKGVEWGELYNKFKDKTLDAKVLEEKVAVLMEDEDVTNKKGIYPYVLDGLQKHLNIRSFSPNMKRESYQRQKGVCTACGKHFEIEEMEGDHITPWSKGGKTTADNCQMLCRECNRSKAGR